MDRTKDELVGPRWRRVVARTLLVTFTTSFVACADSGGEVETTTTVTAMEASTTTAPPPTTPPPPPTAPPSTLPAQPPDQLGKQELRDLVAPVALYPDVVLASLLPATTNPDQVHEAAQYVGQAEVVDRIPDDRGWDGSVVGLLQFPDVLRWLDENPAWTDQMGQAVTYQQGDVLDAIQDYRRAARGVGNLQSNQYQKVRATPAEDIIIEPAQPDVVYVPSYDPVAATQPQPAPSPGINPWIAFGGGAVVGALGAWALYSIFDDDDDDDHYYYGGGGRRRRIRGYDNYYYARGRGRPRPVEWTPRPRARRARAEGWQQPRRLRHVETTAPRTRKRAALRPPATRPATKAAYPTELQRDQGKKGGQRQQRPPKQNAPKAQQQRKAKQGRAAGDGRQPGPNGKAKQGQQRQAQPQRSQQQKQQRQNAQAKKREQQPGNENDNKKKQQGGKRKKGAKQGQGGNQ